MQHFQHHEYMAEELTRLVLILSQHKEVGYEKAEYESYKPALKKADGFSIPQATSLLRSSNRAIDFKMVAPHKEVEQILEPENGYKHAHNWKRGTSKAPPSHTAMWRKGKYISHPHDMWQVYLQEWGELWTQDKGYAQAHSLWNKLEQHTQKVRNNTDVEDITLEELEQEAKECQKPTRQFELTTDRHTIGNHYA